MNLQPHLRCRSRSERYDLSRQADYGPSRLQQLDWQRLLPCGGFEVLPRRWVVERTFAWLSQNRGMGKDYERLYSTGEAFVYAAITRLMVRRLARVWASFEFLTFELPQRESCGVQ